MDIDENLLREYFSNYGEEQMKNMMPKNPLMEKKRMLSSRLIMMELGRQMKFLDLKLKMKDLKLKYEDMDALLEFLR